MPPEVMSALARIEAKLDALLAALADEEEGPMPITLDGEPVGGERPAGVSLG